MVLEIYCSICWYNQFLHFLLRLGALIDILVGICCVLCLSCSCTSINWWFTKTSLFSSRWAIWCSGASFASSVSLCVCCCTTTTWWIEKQVVQGRDIRPEKIVGPSWKTRSLPAPTLTQKIKKKTSKGCWFIWMLIYLWE